MDYRRRLPRRRLHHHCRAPETDSTHRRPPLEIKINGEVVRNRPLQIDAAHNPKLFSVINHDDRPPPPLRITPPPHRMPRPVRGVSSIVLPPVFRSTLSKQGLESLFPMEDSAVMGIWELLPHLNKFRVSSELLFPCFLGSKLREVTHRLSFFLNAMKLLKDCFSELIMVINRAVHLFPLPVSLVRLLRPEPMTRCLPGHNGKGAPI
ncbi:hypothetical protein RHMOL_Rhmol04G0072900 [Rhododendron molle]|uniref:Uncharacterized protein n=1 Tax=Rhododendron molle TaxID=49168 RepID=A0ACC0NZ86_RHOML|nr:hypothetical protein RHMOL_Rhmol04G0072900 [Rhododendron molle]